MNPIAVLTELMTALPEILQVEEELRMLLDLKARGVATDVLVAALKQVEVEANAAEMHAKYPNG